MVILRRTQKLRKLLPVSAAVTPESETALGDWYVNRVMVNRRPLLLVVSSRGLFPLLVPARDVGSLPERLPHLVASALRRLSVPEPLVVAEYHAMAPVLVAPTRDRSILGVMVDSAFALPYYLTPGHWNDDTLPLAEYQLARTPWFAKGQADKVTVPLQAVPELLAARWKL